MTHGTLNPGAQCDWCVAYTDQFPHSRARVRVGRGSRIEISRVRVRVCKNAIFVFVSRFHMREWL